MRRAAWYGHVPGMVYAVSLYADNESDARAALRRFLGVTRLPAGAAVWEAA